MKLKKESNMKFEMERMSDDLVKHHIRGMPFDAVIHHFTDSDKDYPHDHPFGFRSFILKGGYIEDVYVIDKETGKWSVSRIERKEGDSFEIDATHIHKLVELPNGDCWTLILPKKGEQESGFWNFDNEQVMYRHWSQPEFSPFVNH